MGFAGWIGKLLELFDSPIGGQRLRPRHWAHQPKCTDTPTHDPAKSADSCRPPLLCAGQSPRRKKSKKDRKQRQREKAAAKDGATKLNDAMEDWLATQGRGADDDYDDL